MNELKSILILGALLLGAACAPTTTQISRSSTPTAQNRTPSSHQTSLKGSGSQTASHSAAATNQKMAQWDVNADKVQAVSDIVAEAARTYNVDPSLVYGIIWVESRFNPEAKSHVGARGLMQLMPKTADYLADCIAWRGRHDSHDPAFNITAGTYYIARLIKQFDNDVDLALAAYNAGPGNIQKWMNNTGLPPVSIEYYTMVRTAQQYFSVSDDSPAIVPTTQDLDKLGLALLISGLSSSDFRSNRGDAVNPFAMD